MRYVGSFILVLMLVAAPTEGADLQAADLGLIINLDGDNGFPGQTLKESTELLRKEIDGYADANVKTLCYSLASGSEIMLYPTRVANTWGWRKTRYDEDPAWKDRIARIRRNMEEGGDAPRTAGARAKERGMYFFPSLRMNDGHYAFGNPPEDYPLTGKFWLDNRDLSIKKSPIHGKPEYGHLLDYTHQKVRDYRMAQIHEAIERYQDILDGFELDFTRFQVFFPDGKADEGAPLITEMVRQVRERLQDLEKAKGRKLLLIVRVPPALKNCKWSGLDVKAWADQKLVDLVVPSQMMTHGFEQPIDEFKELFGASGPKVYSGFVSRVGWSFPFTADTLAGKFKTSDRAMTIEQIRAAVDNSFFLKADGIYLFNFSHYAALFRNGNGKTAIDISHPESLARQDKVYSITKAYWYDHEDGYEYRKQIPASLDSNAEKSFLLLVGADPKANTAAQACLRVGLRNLAKGTRIELSLNGKSVISGPVEQVAVAAYPAKDDKTAKAVAARVELPTHFVIAKLDDAVPFVRGQNRVTVKVDASDNSKPVSVTDVDLGIFNP